MLAQTTSCDEGVQFDLACDACGAHFEATPAQRRDPDVLWNAAGRAGWVLRSGGGGGGYGHRCGSCAPDATMAAAGRGGAW